MRARLMIILKGFIVGASMLVPGVSGGAMAIMINIYDQLIAAVSHLNYRLKDNLALLILFSLGGICGMILISFPLSKIISAHYNLAVYFFLGAVAGSIPMIIKKTGLKRWRIIDFGYLALGIIFIILMADMPQLFSMNNNTPHLIFLISIGIFSAVACILPGISLSYTWLIWGVYDQVMLAFKELNIGFLAPLGLGLLIGIFLTARFLEKMLNKYPEPTYLIILGFIIGSIISVFPGLPQGGEWLLAPLLFLSGLIALNFLTKLEA